MLLLIASTFLNSYFSTTASLISAMMGSSNTSLLEDGYRIKRKTVDPILITRIVIVQNCQKMLQSLTSSHIPILISPKVLPSVRRSRFSLINFHLQKCLRIEVAGLLHSQQSFSDRPNMTKSATVNVIESIFKLEESTAI